MNGHDVDILQVKANGVLVTGASTGVVNSDPIDVSSYVEAIVFINITSLVTGTSPTLDCKIQYTPDNGKTWVDSGDTFTQITSTSVSIYFKKLSSNFGQKIRLVFTPGGTTPVYVFTPTVITKI